MKLKPKSTPTISISGSPWLKQRLAAILLGVSYLLFPSIAKAQKSTEKKDMLTPDEVPLETPNSTPNNQNGPFLGAGLSLGQARTTEADSSPSVATFYRIEPGYQIGTNSWNRIEISADILTGSLGFRQSHGNLSGKHQLNLDIGFLAKFGYGYSLGNKMFAVAKFGAGALTGNLTATANSQTVKSDSITGTALLLGWNMVVPISTSLDFNGGLSLLHTQFDIGSLKSGPAVYDYGRSLVLNIPSIDLGLRFRL